MKIGVCKSLAVLIGLSASTSLWAIPIINSVSGSTYASNSQTTPSTASQSTTVPHAGAGMASASLATESSSLNYSAAALGGNTTFNYSFNESIGEPGATDASYFDDYSGLVTFHQGDSYAQAMGSANFTLNAGDAGYTYAINGTYLQHGTSYDELYINLYDMTSFAQLLYSQQYDYPVATDANVVYGVSGTANMNLDGSLTGTLEAGHAYAFVFYAVTRHYEYGNGPFTNENGETPTTASGNMTLTLSAPVEAVPEPTSLALFGAGVAALSALGFRRRK